MRIKFTYYILSFLLLMAVSGCIGSKEGFLPEGNQDNAIEIPEYGYIYFDSEVYTRGALYETTAEDKRLKQDFAVIGFTHTYNDWTAAESQARPNVFYNNNILNHPQKVLWNTAQNPNVHTYSPIQAWHGKQMYAFFAYSPVNDTYLKTSSATYEGNPYVDFTFNRKSLADQIDVMTAHLIDVNYRDKTLAFDMKHRLTALDIVANNIYTDEIDEIRIESMSITLNNLLYDQVRIPLNMRDEPALDYSAGMADDKTASYKDLLSGREASVFKGNSNTPLTSSAQKTTMIIIPQQQYYDMNDDGDTTDANENFTMTGSVTVGYATYKNGTFVSRPATKSYDFSINKDLMAKYRYYIQLNFAEGDVTIAILESNVWEEVNIKHDFE